MRYTSCIKADGAPELVMQCFRAETDEAKRDRSGFSLTKSGESAVFDITANDAVALRATLNSITSMLTVIEKMQRL